jgi:hypothetical protein
VLLFAQPVTVLLTTPMLLFAGQIGAWLHVDTQTPNERLIPSTNRKHFLKFCPEHSPSGD